MVAPELHRNAQLGYWSKAWRPNREMAVFASILSNEHSRDVSLKSWFRENVNGADKWG